MITNLLFHKLKGINGWSFQTLQNIDVGKIINIKYSKRLFVLFDREYPYTLSIKYLITHEKPPYTDFTIKQKMGIQCITKRYKNKAELEDDVKQIMKKQQELNSIVSSIYRK